ncbi:MAG: transposase [Selenomonadaceae bacterium]|nr:transposase [Selenomonadaceae bacterium]
MYFVGIDIAKHHHEAAILDESRKLILKKLKLDNLMNQVRKVVFAMEAAAHYWLPLYAHIRQDNQTIQSVYSQNKE